jgi:galactokinase
VDTLSKYIWIYPIESKKSEKVAELIHKTVEEIKENYYDGAPVAVFKILTDAGKEFNTKLIEEKEGIKHIISKNPRGAALSESAILKIRTKIKYLDKNIRKLSLEDLNAIVRNLNLESGAVEIMNKKVFPEPEVVERKKVKESFKQGDLLELEQKRNF